MDSSQLALVCTSAAAAASAGAAATLICCGASSERGGKTAPITAASNQVAVDEAVATAADTTTAVEPAAARRPKPSNKPIGMDSADGLAIWSRGEVALHDTPEDIWLIIHDRVYDLSKFAAQHPGGLGVLKKYGGQIADAGFDPVHSLSIIDDYGDAIKLLGKVAAGDEAVVMPAAKPESADDGFPELSDCLNTYDFYEVAARRMTAEHMAYYQTGGTDLFTKAGNQEIFRRIELVPRVMIDVANVSTATTMLGFPTAAPIYISAAAKGGYAHQEAELALCRAAHTAGVIQMVPHFASKT